MKMTDGFKIVLCIVAMVFLLFSFLDTLNRPKVLISADTVEVVHTGRKITVNDHLSGKEYCFFTHKVKLTDSNTAARTAVQTPTIKIEIVPGNGLIITSDGTVYHITPKTGRLAEWLRK